MVVNTKTVVSTATIVILLLVALHFYAKYRAEKEESKRLLEENNRLYIDKYRLMMESIRENENLSEEIKNQLQDLIKRFEHIKPKVSNQLIEAIDLFGLGRTEKAIQDIYKIIEALLKEHYEKRADFKAWLKGDGNKYRPNLQGYLQYCYNVEKKITQIEHDYIIAIKSVRNAEAHDLDFNLSKGLDIANIIIATSCVVKVAEIVHPEVFESNNLLKH